MDCNLIISRLFIIFRIDWVFTRGITIKCLTCHWTLHKLFSTITLDSDCQSLIVFPHTIAMHVICMHSSLSLHTRSHNAWHVLTLYYQC